MNVGPILITGTNGKTTSTFLLEKFLGRCSRIGTVEYKIGDEVIEAPNTTPESLDIVKMCKRSVEKGMEYTRLIDAQARISKEKDKVRKVLMIHKK